MYNAYVHVATLYYYRDNYYFRLKQRWVVVRLVRRVRLLMVIGQVHHSHKLRSRERRRG
jgi:hypothetical protein